MTEKGSNARVSGKTGKPLHKESHMNIRSKKKSVKENLAFLIEDELEKAEVVLAARSITTELQDFAEKLSMIEAKDIMPMLDQIKTTFGPQAADQFSQVTTAKIRELIGAVQASKNAIDGEIGRMEKMVNGGDGSDAAIDASLPPPEMDAAAAPGGLPMDGMPPGDINDELPPEGAEVPPAEDIGGDDMAGASGFAGRPRKESAIKKGRRLTEENAADSSEFKTHLDALAAFSPKCYTFAQEIIDKIHDLSVGGELRNKLMKSLGHVLSMADSEEVWDDPESIADLGIATHFVDVPMAEVVRTPEVAGIVKNMRELAHWVKLKHNSGLSEDEPVGLPLGLPATPLAAGPVFESFQRARNIKRLRESRNPDRLILSVFRRVFQECRNVVAAVTGTARAFNIDANDVVSIIREAKIKKTRKVDEDAVPALMGVAMGKPDPNSNPALMAQNATAANPQPGKPNIPMTPTDMRFAKNAQEKQDAASAASNQPNQPLIPAKQVVPTQSVKPGQQAVQPVVTPQMQQQMRANGNSLGANNSGKKLPPMPGKVVNNNNIRTM